MKIKDILDWLDGQGEKYRFTGDADTEVTCFSSIYNYKYGSITWIKKEENYENAGRPKNISVAVVQNGVEVDFENVISTLASKEVFFEILRHFWGDSSEAGNIGQGTVISKDVVKHPTVSIGCNCSIVGNIEIGEGTVIEHNVVIQGAVRIGKNCHIQSGSIIGIDGYGYSQSPETKRKKMVEHFGGVQIGDEVFIGSHTNIARGTIDDTVIGDGVKIAPSTHIGHNNRIGEDTAIICSTLYGSSVIGNRAYITASIIANQITIGNDTVIGMGSVATKPIGSNVIAYGSPARIKRENSSEL